MKASIFISIAAAFAVLLPGLAAAQTPAATQAGSGDALSLTQALQQVKARNEEWAITRSRIKQSEAQRREALAGLLPQLSLSGSVSRRDKAITFGTRVVRPLYDWNGAGTASMVLFDGTKYPLYSSAGEMVKASKADAVWQRQTLRFQTVQAYDTLEAAQREVAIDEDTVQLRHAYVVRAQVMHKHGLALPLDVSRAQNQLLEARQALLDAQARRGNAADALATLLGRTPGAPLRVRPLPNPPQTPPQSASVTNLSKRADFASQQFGLNATHDQQTSVWWSFFPKVQLQANATVGPPSFSNPDLFAWSVTLSASWLLYDGGMRFAQAEQLKQQALQQKLALRQSLRQAHAGITEALRNWRSAFAAIDVARKQVKVAQDTYAMVRTRFKHGLATSIDVTDASQSLFTARLSLNAARLGARLAASQYRYLVTITQKLPNP